MSTSSETPHRPSGEWKKHAFIWVLLSFELFPFYMMLQICLKDQRQFLQNPWLPMFHDMHWENLRFAFKLILPYLANTVFVSVCTTFLSIAISLIATYFFARYRMPGGKFLWGAFLFLMLLPSIANIVPIFSLLKSFHLLNSLWALIVVGVAGSQVFQIYVLRNFIEDLPKDLFEAAEIDGATHLQQLWNVVVPLSGPILATLSILTFLGQWNEFMMPLLVLRDHSLFTLGVGLIYLDGEYVKNYGQIMSVFLLSSVPLIVIFAFAMKLFVQGLSSGALKG